MTKSIEEWTEILDRLATPARQEPVSVVKQKTAAEIAWKERRDQRLATEKIRRKLEQDGGFKFKTEREREAKEQMIDRLRHATQLRGFVEPERFDEQTDIGGSSPSQKETRSGLWTAEKERKPPRMTAKTYVNYSGGPPAPYKRSGAGSARSASGSDEEATPRASSARPSSSGGGSSWWRRRRTP